MDSRNSPLTHTLTPSNTHTLNSGQHSGGDGSATAEEVNDEAIVVDHHGEGDLDGGVGDSITAWVRAEFNLVEFFALTKG